MRITRTGAVAAALWAGLAVMAGPARGQGNTWAGAALARVMESTRWRLDALRINASFALANTGYDTDIFYGYMENAYPDATATAEAPVQVFLPVGKTVVLEVFDSPQYLFYLDHANERAWNNILRGQLHFAWNRIYAQASAGMSDVRQRLSPELNINVRERTDRLSGALLWQWSEEASMAFLCEDTRYRYGDVEIAGANLADVLDRREDFFDVVAYLQPRPRLRFFVNGQYGTYAFRADVSRNARSYGAFGGLAFVPREGEERPIAPPQGSISLGYKRLDMRDPLFKDGSDFVGTVNVSAGIFRRTELRGYFSRDFTYSAYSSGTYYISTTWGGGLLRRLTRRMTVSYDFSRIQSAYPASGEGSAVDHNYRYAIHQAALNVRFSRDLEVMFFASFGQRAQEAPALTRNRNFFGLNLIYGTPTSSVPAPARGLSR